MERLVLRDDEVARQSFAAAVAARLGLDVAQIIDVDVWRTLQPRGYIVEALRVKPR